MKRLIALLLAVLLLVGCGGSVPSAPAAPQPERYEYFTFDVFDTVTQVMGYARDREEWNRFMSVYHDILLEYHQLYDIYNEYPGVVNLAAVNKSAGGDPVEVDDRILDLLELAKEVYTLTDGKNNVAAGAVLRLWHEARTAGLDDPAQAALPDEEALREAALHCNMEDIVIDREAHTVQLLDPEMSLDVGSIGKGYATQRAALDMQAGGLEVAYFNVGGNGKAMGFKPDGSSWSSGVETPWKDDPTLPAYLDALNISDTCLVVSGNYQRFYTVDGVDYNHLIDFDTLFPADRFSSVAVLCADSGLADGLSTGLFCMDYEEGLALVESLEGVEAKWFYPDHSSRESSGWEGYVRKL